MKKALKKILKVFSSVLFTLLIIIIFVILAYVVYVQVLTSKGKVSEVKVNFYTILTQSMYPTISAGDIVVSYKNSDNIYNVGDIITFVSTSQTSKGLTITHRVIEVFELNGEYSYRTQGDNNNVADSSSVPSKNVIGRVVFKIPKAGYIQQFLVTKTGWIVAIVIPCLGIIIYDILKILTSIGKTPIKRSKKREDTMSLDEKNNREILDKVIEKEDGFDLTASNTPDSIFVNSDSTSLKENFNEKSNTTDLFNNIKDFDNFTKENDRTQNNKIFELENKKDKNYSEDIDIVNDYRKSYNVDNNERTNIVNDFKKSYNVDNNERTNIVNDFKKSYDVDDNERLNIVKDFKKSYDVDNNERIDIVDDFGKIYDRNNFDIVDNNVGNNNISSVNDDNLKINDYIDNINNFNKKSFINNNNKGDDDIEIL